MQSRTEQTGLSTSQGYGWRRARGTGGGDGDGIGEPDGADRRDVRESRLSPSSRDGALKVGDLPTWPIPVIPAHLAMGAARKVAALKRVALLVVERDEQLVGYVNERALATASDEARVIDLVTRFDRCLSPSMSIADARRCFISARAAVLPVVAAGFVLGAIGRGEVERRDVARRTPGATRSSPSGSAAA